MFFTVKILAGGLSDQEVRMRRCEKGEGRRGDRNWGGGAGGRQEGDRATQITPPITSTSQSV
jgi:hypothetical protein